jgi:predicted Zn-dependent protease
MSQRILFLAALLLAIAGLVLSEVRKADAPVSPAPLLYFLADTQRELTRLPVSFKRIPDNEEVVIGDQIARYYSTAQNPDRPDAEREAIEAYVRKVGGRLAPRAKRRLPYRFHYIPDHDFISAFSLPGGHVFVGAGLMALMHSEDELAGVLGHEIEHIDHYHCAERLQVEAALRKLPLGALAAIPVEIFMAGYSKDQELEADREGASLAAAAGYSPLEIIALFSEFGRLWQENTAPARNPQEELSTMANAVLAGYFRSHPLSAERVEQIRSRFSQPGQTWPSRRPLEFSYVFLRERARRQVGAKRYSRAVLLAAQALALQPDDAGAQRAFAEARFALGDYDVAVATYRKLVGPHPQDADGVRQFADALARKALEDFHGEEAAKLAHHALELQPDHPETLNLLARAQLQSSDFTGATETTRKIRAMYPANIGEVKTYAETLASQAFKSFKYERAAKLSAFTLALFTDKEDAQPMMVVLAESEFARANFSGAAVAYRKLAEMSPGSEAYLFDYADALGAAGSPLRGAAEIESLLSQRKKAGAAEIIRMRIEATGLRLLAGDEAPARTLRAQAEGPNPQGFAPEFLGRLSWWYYRAGKSPQAAAILRRALTVRPGEAELLIDFAWAELENGALSDAQSRFAAVNTDAILVSPLGNSPVMGRAIARWRMNQQDAALRDFDSVVARFPQWTDPAWVRALYPASVAQTAAALAAEHDRRAALAKSRTIPSR